MKHGTTKQGTTAELYLDGRPVGTVVFHRSRDSWNFGRFEPGEGFAAYAPRYARWAMLMHEDEGGRLSEAAAEELRAAENDLMGIRAKLFFPDREEWQKAAVVTIDGEWIEWKVF